MTSEVKAVSDMKSFTLYNLELNNFPVYNPYSFIDGLWGHSGLLVTSEAKASIWYEAINLNNVCTNVYLAPKYHYKLVVGRIPILRPAPAGKKPGSLFEVGGIHIWWRVRTGGDKRKSRPHYW